MTGWAPEECEADAKVRSCRRSSKYCSKMRSLSLFCLLVMPFALAAQYNDEPLAVDKGPEGHFLDLVDLVEEPEKQLNLLDTFVVQFPNYGAMSTIHAQRQELL